jgi:hypothetical protein
MFFVVMEGYGEPMKTTQLVSLYQRPGPFASVTLDVSRDDEAGAHEHELRVRAACEDLLELGADPTAVEQMAARLGAPVNRPAPVSRTVVVAYDSVVFDELMFTRVDRPVVSWGPLPDISTWLQHEDGTTPFVLAVVDHEGGDVATYTSDVPDPQEEEQVGGETHHAHRVPVGGWSALRYQHTTENVWQRNASAVADQVRSHIRAGYRLVLLAGDPRSRSMVMEELADSPATIMQLESGSRADDGGDEAFAQAIREALLEHTVARRLELSHELKDRLGRDHAVATGVRDVVDAFVRGQVDTLLIDPPAAAELTLDPAEHPGLILGEVEATSPLRADQALVAAAAITSADVRVSRRATLVGSPVAALLRWDQLAVGTTG